ncbi:MAG: hypothetical protein QXM16_02730 [Nitrososphaerota archaeon]
MNDGEDSRMRERFIIQDTLTAIDMAEIARLRGLSPERAVTLRQKAWPHILKRIQKFVERRQRN